MFIRHLITKGGTGSLLAGLTVVMMLVCHGAAVFAQDRCWTMGESTGTVDEADLNLVTLTDNTAAISSAVPNATGNIRYNVVAVDGVFGGDRNTKSLTVRFADNGGNARVLVHLRRVHMDSGVLTTLATLDSNEYPASIVAQTQYELFNCGDPEFDFENHIYYVEAQLIKTGSSGTPLIRSIHICPSLC
jgi:hypothetical protein